MSKSIFESHQPSANGLLHKFNQLRNSVIFMQLLYHYRKNLSKQTKVAKRKFEHQIKHHPWSALLIAAAIGFLLVRPKD